MIMPMTDDDKAEAFYLTMVQELDRYKNNKGYFSEKSIVRRALSLRYGYTEPPELWSGDAIIEKKAQRMYCDICGSEDDENHNDKSCTLAKLDAMKMLALERDLIM